MLLLPLLHLVLTLVLFLSRPWLDCWKIGACKLSVTDLLAALQFGEIDIDSSLVVSKDTLPDSGEQIMMLNNGCMCCTVRDDLVNMLNDLVCCCMLL